MKTTSKTEVIFQEVTSPVCPAPQSRVRSHLVFGATLAVLLSAGCASTSPTYHRYVMQGQVLSVDANSLVVCLGKRDGAEVGQELTIVRHVPKPQYCANRPVAAAFQRDLIGKVRIASVTDEHYSNATVLSGSPQVNDLVELERK